MKRYQGKELQELLDEKLRKWNAVPDGHCMFCRRAGRMEYVTTVIVDQLTLMEGGKPTINAEATLRLCPACTRRVLSSPLTRVAKTDEVPSPIEQVRAIRRRIEAGIAEQRAANPGACLRCCSRDDVQVVKMYAMELDEAFTHEYCAACRKSLQEQSFTKPAGSA